MAIPAVYSFLGFPGWGPLHLYLHQDGYPAGAALRLGAALEATVTRERGPADLVGGFLCCHRQAEPLSSPEFSDDCSYRYLIVYRQGGRWPLRISGWRHLAEEGRWGRRFGPMPLEDFLRRFHPCRHQPWSPAAVAWRA
jgi:hypothetical protein